MKQTNNKGKNEDKTKTLPPITIESVVTDIENHDALNDALVIEDNHVENINDEIVEKEVTPIDTSKTEELPEEVAPTIHTPVNKDMNSQEILNDATFISACSLFRQFTQDSEEAIRQNLKLQQKHTHYQVLTFKYNDIIYKFDVVKGRFFE